jgi:hypothetical protein
MGKKMAVNLPTVFVFVMCMTDQHCEVVRPIGEYTCNSLDECNQKLAVIGTEIRRKNEAADRELKAAAGVTLPHITSISCRPQIADWYINQMDKLPPFN